MVLYNDSQNGVRKNAPVKKAPPEKSPPRKLPLGKVPLPGKMPPHPPGKMLPEKFPP